MARSKKSAVKSLSDAELLSYIINQDPVLSANIDLPKQGESIIPIGKLIMSNGAYRNAFINTINVIGRDIIKRNIWDNPWDFTKRGEMGFGQHVREMIADLCNVYDYNSPSNDETRFLTNVVPNVLSYIHEINFQKFYETTTSDSQLAMAFTSEGGLYDLIEQTIGMLYESLKYDEWLVDKYQLCRRIVDGTMTVKSISTDGDPRYVVAQMKSATNKMTFRSPNYNPAGIRRANKFEDLITIMDSDFEGIMSTGVLATSYYKDEAELRTGLRLIDSFSESDEARLTELLGDAYTAFTDTEKAQLANIPAVVISREWFMDYDYLLDTASESKATEFYNPTTLKNNHFLHKWGVKSTSPFEQALVFVANETPSVTSVTVSPSTGTVIQGQSLQMSATVVTSYFANKAVTWSVVDSTTELPVEGVTIDENGLLKVGADVANNLEFTVTATSVYDSSISGTATIATPVVI